MHRNRIDKKNIQTLLFILLAGVHSAAYDILIDKIELFNKCLCFTLIFLIALDHTLPAPYTFIRYYIFNMDKESYFLFCPSWFVLTIGLGT